MRTICACRRHVHVHWDFSRWITSGGHRRSGLGRRQGGVRRRLVTIGAEPFRWTETDGLVGLGELSGGLNETRLAADAYFVKTASADGSTIVGNGGSSNGFEAFRWTEATGMVALGDLPGGDFRSRASGISADGLTLVGTSAITNGEECFRWTPATGMVGIGDLPGGDFYSDAMDVSADGSVIVGGSVTANGVQAYRWTEATGMVGLGKLPGSLESQASAVSTNGAVVAGAAILATTLFRGFAGRRRAEWCHLAVAIGTHNFSRRMGP